MAIELKFAISFAVLAVFIFWAFTDSDDFQDWEDNIDY